MTKAVTTRLNEKELEKIEAIAKRESVDRSSLIRKFVLSSLKNYSMNENAKYYQKGLMSLAEAATNADVPLWEMMEFIESQNIRPPTEDPDEIKKELLDVK